MTTSSDDLYDPYWFIQSTVVQLENTDKILHVHEDIRCNGKPCAVHNRTEHGLRLMAQTWDPGSRTYFRVCEHGDSHPDPDWAWWQNSIGNSEAANHTCDGCCLGHYYHYNSATPASSN